MADRSDRGRQSPCGSTSFELARMIGSPGTQDRPRWSVRSGERLADLIKASGHARRTHRPHGWLQPMTAAKLSKKCPCGAGGVHGWTRRTKPYRRRVNAALAPHRTRHEPASLYYSYNRVDWRPFCATGVPPWPSCGARCARSRRSRPRARMRCARCTRTRPRCRRRHRTRHRSNPNARESWRNRGRAAGRRVLYSSPAQRRARRGFGCPGGPRPVHPPLRPGARSDAKMRHHASLMRHSCATIGARHMRGATRTP
jgi:hypothetical protein